MPIFPLTRARADDGQAARSRPSSAGSVETSELRTLGGLWNLARSEPFLGWRSCRQIGRTGVEASEAYRMASNLGATGGRLGFKITPWSVTSTRASG